MAKKTRRKIDAALKAKIALEAVPPKLAYVTAKFAALAPFAKVAEFLAELLPVGGAVNAGTARNRTRRVRSSACLGRLAKRANWLDCGHVRDVRSAVAARRHVNDLIEYLRANRHALADYGQRRHDGSPISTAFVERAVNEILSKRMIKKAADALEPMDRAALPRRAHRSPQ